MWQKRYKRLITNISLEIIQFQIFELLQAERSSKLENELETCNKFYSYSKFEQDSLFS